MERLIDMEDRHLCLLRKLLSDHLANKTVWAYGSRAKWNAKQSSDLDLVVWDASTTQITEAIDAFSESNLPFTVQLFAWENTSEDFQEDIRKKYVVLQEGSKIPEGWREAKLGDVSVEIIDGDRGKNYPKSEQFFSKGYCLFLNTKNVTKDGFNFSECYFITKEKDNELKKGKLKRNDVVLTTRGTVGNVAFYDAHIYFEHIRINSGMVIVRPIGINPKFNFQLFKYLNKDFLNFSSGSAQPQLPVRDLKEIIILLPPLPEQKAIAEVLSSLDDKINLLHRQNKTLENIAQTLFRKWFIEDAGEEWEERKLGDFISISSGKGLKKDDYNHEGTIPVLGANGFIGRTNDFLFDEPLIFTGRAGTLGKVFISRGKVWLTDNTLVIKTTFEYFFWVYFLLKNEGLEQYNVGSTQPLIRQSEIKGMIVSIPDKAHLDKFKKLTREIFEEINFNQSMICTLETMRDTFLPYLINGKVRVGGF